jgi:hypothetical protein
MVENKDSVVRIDSDLMEQVKEYTAKTGIPARRVLDDAVKHFLEQVAPARLRALGIKPDKKG